MIHHTPMRLPKPAKLHCRTTHAVLTALQAEALRHNRSISELLHIILSEHFGFDPASGLKIAPSRCERVPASGPTFTTRMDAAKRTP